MHLRTVVIGCHSFLILLAAFSQDSLYFRVGDEPPVPDLFADDELFLDPPVNSPGVTAQEYRKFFDRVISWHRLALKI